MVFVDDNKILFGSEVDIVWLVVESFGLEVNVVFILWEDWLLGVIFGKYDVVISNIIVIKEWKEKFDFVIYCKDLLGFYVKSISLLSKIDKVEDIVGLKIIVGFGINQEVILLVWNVENVKKGLKLFILVYIKDDVVQMLVLQIG